MTILAIPRKRLKSFLKKLANLQASSEAVEQLKREFPEFLPDFPTDSRPAKLLRERLSREQNGLGWSTAEPAFRSISIARLRRQCSEEQFAELLGHPQEIPVLLLLLLTVHVQQAWETSIVETREWRISRLRNEVWELLTPDGWDVPDEPPVMPLYQAISHLQNESSWARRCGNGDCVEPFFFAKWKNQNFCGPKCAAHSKRAAKRRSWQKHPEWNAKRRKSGKNLAP
jgi:hypothetical protein